jgi:hypothetical protein
VCPVLRKLIESGILDPLRHQSETGSSKKSLEFTFEGPGDRKLSQHDIDIDIDILNLIFILILI